jgi:predicted RNase H-like HicB family nuclease
MASCINLEGCDVRGETFGQAIGNLMDAAEAAIELRYEQGLSLPPQYDGDDRIIVRAQMPLDIEDAG